MIDPRIKRFVELEEQIAALEQQVKDLKSESDKLNEELQDGFIEAGVNSINVAGKTVYLSHQLWASVRADRKEEAKEVLSRHGLGGFIKENVNSQQLSAWFRERRDSGDDIPEDIKAVTNATEKWDVRVRKA